MSMFSLTTTTTTTTTFLSIPPRNFSNPNLFFLHFPPTKPFSLLRTSPNHAKSTSLRISLSHHTLPFRTFQNFPSKIIIIKQFLASLLLFFSFGVCAASARLLPANSPPVQEQTLEDEDVEKTENVESLEDEEKAAFESWKSKTYALTVPLRIVALRGSIPPSWIKEFMRSQGRRSKLQPEFRGTIEDIFSDLSASFSKGNIKPKSAMAADIVSMGDSWLNLAIGKSIIEPIEEHQDWFKDLSDKWKIFLRRNRDGQLDSEGKVWAAPYRWGSMVIAYKKNKFQKHNLTPIKDWSDLFQPGLAGRISMVDSPREIIGAVLKYMGSSYNTEDIGSEVAGGRSAVLKNLALLGNQVRLFNSAHYLKAFAVGDVWVAVGWSSDVLPAAKRMSNVAVIVPKSGASLWADLWAVPAATTIATNSIGGRVRGPSPLIHQWIEFCLQDARTLPFKQDVIPGASPSALDTPSLELPSDLTKGKPKLETNLIAGVPPPDILAKCEFLEPLSDATLLDFKWLISSLQKHGRLHNLFSGAN